MLLPFGLAEKVALPSTSVGPVLGILSSHPGPPCPCALLIASPRHSWTASLLSPGRDHLALPVCDAPVWPRSTGLLDGPSASGPRLPTRLGQGQGQGQVGRARRGGPCSPRVSRVISPGSPCLACAERLWYGTLSSSKACCGLYSFYETGVRALRANEWHKFKSIVKKFASVRRQAGGSDPTQPK